ncbi:hypothetical protein DFA_07368 [Cavenderia fasciculata]|uniref:RING zinc finger-containing protein n=1 Tax=Cavenderia fasciculata TaxID=261658 RepID=F4PW81_CACFS|nr:uncharacterized protein DFA_07368 [Cavenderia fasciculata]EGG20245.1 hypothetical protein DFA_07368 [Cavenderia fasciculata]|eukprot:XP_004367228.1 hypothetical protein DFA_07368 [Cavenderia fasciculata]
MFSSFKHSLLSTFSNNNNNTETNNNNNNNETTIATDQQQNNINNINNVNETTNINTNDGGTTTTTTTTTTGLNKLNVAATTDTFKKIGSKFSLFASNVMTKIDEERKKLLEESEDQNKQSNDDELLLPPWMDFELDDKESEKQIIDRILDLKMSKKTFMNSPPIDSDYTQEFDDFLIAIAKSTLKYDKNMERVRFLLVPRFISEEQFWKNWYYRVMEVRKEYNIISNKKKLPPPPPPPQSQPLSLSTNNNNNNNSDQSVNKKITTTTITNNDHEDDSEIGRWEKELQKELNGLKIEESDIIMDLSINSNLIIDDDVVDDDDDDNQQDHTQQQSTTYDSDEDLDKELEKELELLKEQDKLKQSSNSNLKNSTTSAGGGPEEEEGKEEEEEEDELLKEIENEYQSSSNISSPYWPFLQMHLETSDHQQSSQAMATVVVNNNNGGHHHHHHHHNHDTNSMTTSSPSLASPPSQAKTNALLDLILHEAHTCILRQSVNLVNERRVVRYDDDEDEDEDEDAWSDTDWELGYDHHHPQIKKQEPSQQPEITNMKTTISTTTNNNSITISSSSSTTTTTTTNNNNNNNNNYYINIYDRGTRFEELLKNRRQQLNHVQTTTVTTIADIDGYQQEDQYGLVQLFSDDNPIYVVGQQEPPILVNNNVPPPVVRWRNRVAPVQRGSGIIKTGNKESFECPICLDEVYNTFEFSCLHKYCLECAKQHLTEEVWKHKGKSLNCPNPSCRLRMTNTTILVKILDPHVYKKYELFRSIIDKSIQIGSTIVFCLNCSNPLVREEKKEKEKEKEKESSKKPNFMVCDNLECGAMICPDCITFAHPEETCDEHQKKIKESLTEDDLKTLKYIEECQMKPCPKCGILTIKDQGCEYVCCGTCGHQFCYYCLDPHDHNMTTHIHGPRFQKPIGQPYYDYIYNNGNNRRHRGRRIAKKIGLGILIGVGCVVVAPPAIVLGAIPFGIHLAYKHYKNKSGMKKIRKMVPIRVDNPKPLDAPIDEPIEELLEEELEVEDEVVVVVEEDPVELVVPPVLMAPPLPPPPPPLYRPQGLPPITIR